MPNKNKGRIAPNGVTGKDSIAKSDADFSTTLDIACRNAGRELQDAYVHAFGSSGLFPSEDSLCSSVMANASSRHFRARGKRKPQSSHDDHGFARLNETQNDCDMTPGIEELETNGDSARIFARDLCAVDDQQRDRLVGKTVEIVDIACICLDATSSAEIVWPSEEMKERGSVDTWPLWGWMESLKGRKAKVVQVWHDKMKCCQGGVTILLLDIDGFFVPMLEKGVQEVDPPTTEWDEEEMAAGTTSWLHTALMLHDLPIEALARRTAVSVEDIRKWLRAPGKHTHTPDDAGGKTITEKIHRFLLRTASCEVCLGKICSCCHIFCSICEKLHCRGCAEQCVRCDDCLKCFELGRADYCEECEDNFCGCQRDRLSCDGCGDTLCSECAVILPCFNCGKGHCLMTKKYDLHGCCNEDNLWMCPDCRSVGYCRGPPHPSSQGQWCMEYGSIVCHACGHRVCLDCAMESPTSFAGHAACTRCGNRRSGRSAQLLKLKLKRRTDSCRSGKCVRCKHGSQGRGGKQVGNGEAKLLTDAASADEAMLAEAAMLELIQEEEEKEKGRQRDAVSKTSAAAAKDVLPAPTDVRIARITCQGDGGKKSDQLWSVELAWGQTAHPEEAKRAQVRLDGVELRVCRLEVEGQLVVCDVKLEGSKHVLLLRVARARGPWSAWSAEVRFSESDYWHRTSPAPRAAETAREGERKAALERAGNGKETKKSNRGSRAPEKAASDNHTEDKSAQQNGRHKEESASKAAADDEKGLPQGTNSTTHSNGAEVNRKQEEDEVGDWETAQLPVAADKGAILREVEKNSNDDDDDDDHDEDEEDEEEDEDALLRLAALSNAKRAPPPSPKRKLVGSRQTQGGASLSRETSGESMGSLAARPNAAVSGKTRPAGTAHWQGSNGPSVGAGSRHLSGQVMSEARRVATSSAQKTVAWENGNLVMCCPLNSKEKGSVIGERGARVKELKKRWPRVFVYVERDSRVTVRGAVPEEVEACTQLLLFFKDKDKDWDPASWCLCGACKTPLGCAARRPPARPAAAALSNPVDVAPAPPQPVSGARTASPPSASWGDSWGGGSSFGSAADGAGAGRGVCGAGAEVEDWELEDSCAICFERDADVRLLPCGHSLCYACADQCRHRTIFLAQQGVTCPFCRTVVDATQHVTAASRSLPRPAAWQRQVSDLSADADATTPPAPAPAPALAFPPPADKRSDSHLPQRDAAPDDVISVPGPSVVGGGPSSGLSALSLLRLEGEGTWHGTGIIGGGSAWGEPSDGAGEGGGWGDSLLLGQTVPEPSWSAAPQDVWGAGQSGHRVAMLLQRQQQQLQMQDTMMEVQEVGREEDASLMRMMFGVNLT